MDSGVKFEISLQNPKIVPTESILLHVKHQLFVPFMFNNQFVTYLKLYILGMLRLDCRTKMVQNVIIYIYTLPGQKCWNTTKYSCTDCAIVD